MAAKLTVKQPGSSVRNLETARTNKHDEVLACSLMSMLTLPLCHRLAVFSIIISILHTKWLPVGTIGDV